PLGHGCVRSPLPVSRRLPRRPAGRPPGRRTPSREPPHPPSGRAPGGAWSSPPGEARPGAGSESAELRPDAAEGGVGSPGSPQGEYNRIIIRVCLAKMPMGTLVNDGQGKQSSQVSEKMAAHWRLWPAAWLRARGTRSAAEAWMRHFEE